MTRQPEWPNFGDGRVHHLRQNERGVVWRRVPGGSQPSDEKWPPPGSIVVRKDSKPEDLIGSGLSPDQIERLIEAVKEINKSAGFSPLLELGFAQRADEEREEFVQSIEELRSFNKTIRERQRRDPINNPPLNPRSN